MAARKIARKKAPKPYDIYEALDDSQVCLGCGEKIKKGDRFARMKGPASEPFCSDCADCDTD